TVDGAPANVIYTNCYNAAGVVPGYGIVNARVSWENVANQGFDLSLFVNNVTDKYYSRAAITALSTLDIFATAIGEPRMWGWNCAYRSAANVDSVLAPITQTGKGMNTARRSCPLLFGRESLAV